MGEVPFGIDENEDTTPIIYLKSEAFKPSHQKEWTHRNIYVGRKADGFFRLFFRNCKYWPAAIIWTLVNIFTIPLGLLFIANGIAGGLGLEVQLKNNTRAKKHKKEKGKNL